MLISNAKSTDYLAIIKFIDLNWKKNHILCTNLKVFNHFYKVSKNKLGFIIAKDQGNIIGLIGYINNKKFNQKINKTVIWLTMWCTKKNAESLVGLKLLDFIEKNFPYNIIASLGVNNRVIDIYRRFGYQCGKADHLFIKRPLKPNIYKKKNWKIKQELFRGNLINDNYAKNYTYLNNKYTKSGFYKYLNFSIYFKEQPVCNIVTRKIISKEYNNAILRIIDFSGNINALHNFALLIYKDKKFDDIGNIDILLHNLDKVKIMGFKKTNRNEYLPIYFEPLIKKYSEKNFIYKINKKSKTKNFLIVTGDCDQDRPNK